MSDWFCRSLKSNFFVTTGLFFLKRGQHREPQSCIGERERQIDYFDWSIKILILRNFHDVFQKCFKSTFESSFFIPTGGLLIVTEKNCYWSLLICRVTQVSEMKLFEPCIEISKVRNIQLLHFWLTYLHSRSQNSPSPNFHFFPTKSALETLELYWKTREEKTIIFFNPSKSWLCENSEMCFKNVLTRFLNASFSTTTGWILIFAEKKIKWKLHTYCVGWEWKI